MAVTCGSDQEQMDVMENSYTDPSPTLDEAPGSGQDYVTGSEGTLTSTQMLHHGQW